MLVFVFWLWHASQAEAEKALKECAWDEPRLLSQWSSGSGKGEQRQSSGRKAPASAAVANSRSIHLQSVPETDSSPEADSSSAAADKGKGKALAVAEGAPVAAAVESTQAQNAERDDECLVCFDPVPQGEGLRTSLSAGAED